MAEEGLRVVGWRDVPVDDSMIGPTARSVMPQLPPRASSHDPGGSDRASTSTASCSCVRKRCEHEMVDGQFGAADTELSGAIYFPSLS